MRRRLDTLKPLLGDQALAADPDVHAALSASAGTGKTHVLKATCRCLLPDNLAEEIEVVVEGTIHADRIHGDKIITRCASKYEPAVRMATRVKSAS